MQVCTLQVYVSLEPKPKIQVKTTSVSRQPLNVVETGKRMQQAGLKTEEVNGESVSTRMHIFRSCPQVRIKETLLLLLHLLRIQFPVCSVSKRQGRSWFQP
ncbi:hypothetical protein Droror1_Dr00003848 [Drosera rotundifolia]